MFAYLLSFRLRLIILLLILSPVVAGAGSASLKHYRCVKATGPIVIDGRLDEFDWGIAERVGQFTRILYTYPEIKYHTEASLLWDDHALYVAFSCRDQEIWATMTTQDSSLWNEEVVEVFIDPDGDGRDYYELEVNPLNVVVDLKIFTLKPEWKSDVPGFDTKNLKTAVKVYGTVNDPADRDTGWTVEMAIPWEGFEEIPGGTKPKPGDQWRLNLYRIERGGGIATKREIDRLNAEQVQIQDRKTRKIEDVQRLAEIRTKLQQLEDLTEYTAWSGTYERGFHDPTRFGVVEFVP
jgi:hypothetical protein